VTYFTVRPTAKRLAVFLRCEVSFLAQSGHADRLSSCPLYPRLCCKTRMHLPTGFGREFLPWPLFRSPAEGGAVSMH